MSTLRVVTLAGDHETEARMAARLGDHKSVELFMRCVDRSELLAAIRAGGLHGLIAIGMPTWFDRQCFQESLSHDVRVIGLPRDPLEADAFETLGGKVLPVDSSVDQIVSVLEALHESHPSERHLFGGHPSGKEGRIVSVWGPKGSPGRSTVAVELAYAFSFSDPTTLLVDADPYGGDLKQLLAVVEEIPSVLWAASEASKNGFDLDVLLDRLRRAGVAGPVLLPGLPRSDLWEDVSDFGWRHLLSVLPMSFKTTVVDVGFCLEPGRSPIPEFGDGRNRMARSVIAASDTVVAVVKADPVGIKNLLWSFDHLNELVDPGSIMVVANQVRSGHEREVVEIVRRYSNKSPVVLIPFEPNDVAAASSFGRSVRESKPGSPIVRAIDDLAASLGADVERRGLLTRLVGRR